MHRLKLSKPAVGILVLWMTASGGPARAQAHCEVLALAHAPERTALAPPRPER